MSAPPESRPAFSNSRTILWLHEHRRGLCAWGYVLFVLYASILPFDLKLDIGLAKLDSISHALHATRQHARSDLIVNVLYYVPLGCTVCLAIRHRFGRWWPGLAAGIAAGTLLSGAVEFVQLFSPSRVASQWDVLANAAGSSIGCAAAVPLHFVLRAWRRQRYSAMASQPIWHLMVLTSLLLFVTSLVPFDVRVDLGEIAGGLRNAGAHIVPFATIHPPAGAEPPTPEVLAEFWVEFGGTVAAFFGLAALLGLATVGEARMRVFSSLFISVYVGVVLAVMCEVAQVFIATRGFDVTDILAGVIGIAGGTIVGLGLGALAARRHWHWGGETRLVGRPVLLLSLLVQTAYLVANGLRPFAFGKLPDLLDLPNHVEWVPFRAFVLHLTGGAIAELTLELARYAVFGALLAVWLRAYGVRFRTRNRVAVVLAVLLSAAIEVAQTALPSRYSDVSDVLTGAFGSLCGSTAVKWYADAVEYARQRIRARHSQATRRPPAAAPTSAALPGTPPS